MPNVDDIITELAKIAPLELAESWDNVGLLVGDRRRRAERVMTCLTLTPKTVAEAIERQANLVVVHHPLPFKPVTRVTTDTIAGRLLWDLIGASVAVYSAHTAYDSTREGINATWASALGLEEVRPLVPATSSPHASLELGAGRCGRLDSAISLAALATRVKTLLMLPQVRIVGSEGAMVERIAIACGSGGSFLAAASAENCECLVTGEAGFHTCLEAEAMGISMILTGHYASERFAMERLAEDLTRCFPTCEVWASQTERDPLGVV